MKELRERIQQDKDKLFRMDAPDAGHRERFRKRLKNEQHKPFFNKNNPFWLYAAAASLLLLIGTFVMQWSSESQTVPVVLSEVSPEHAKMEDFFKEQIHRSTAEIELSNDSLVQKYFVDLQALDLEHKRLEDLHGKSPGNEKVVNALIRNYKNRLRILESLKRYIELKKQRNQQNDEFTTI